MFLQFLFLTFSCFPFHFPSHLAPAVSPQRQQPPPREDEGTYGFLESPAPAAPPQGDHDHDAASLPHSLASPFARPPQSTASSPGKPAAPTVSKKPVPPAPLRKTKSEYGDSSSPMITFTSGRGASRPPQVSEEPPPFVPPPPPPGAPAAAAGNAGGPPPAAAPKPSVLAKPASKSSVSLTSPAAPAGNSNTVSTLTSAAERKASAPAPRPHIGSVSAAGSIADLPLPPVSLVNPDTNFGTLDVEEDA
jgi:hypothetical protein